MTGTLFLIPAPLDHGCPVIVDLRDVMPQATLEKAAQLDHWICENAKSARAYIARAMQVTGVGRPLAERTLTELPRHVHKAGDHDGRFDASPLLAPALAGADMGLVCEAGMPAVADPGSSVVRAAHRLGLRVQPMIGPTSLILALAASGLNGQSFTFAGYVPVEAGPRRQKLLELEGVARRQRQTQMVIETPYRSQALLEACVQTLKPDTWLAMASSITLPNALFRSAPVAQWRQLSVTLDKDQPTVFCIGM